MEGFDRWLIHIYNPLAGRAPRFDRLVAHLAFDDLLKGGVVLAVFWGLWLSRPPPVEGARADLLATLAAGAAAVVAARALAVALPFRPRPRFGGDFVPPHGSTDMGALPSWSAFPSDHAALFVALAVGFLFVSRRAGLSTLAYVAVAILAPRLYLGIHYPTDVLGGAAIGAAAACGAALARRRVEALRRAAAAALAALHRWPGPAYALLYAATFEVAMLFGNLRGLARAIAGA